MMRIVLNYVHDEAVRKVEEALGGRPCSAEEKENIAMTLIEHLEVHGAWPEFKLS